MHISIKHVKLKLEKDRVDVYAIEIHHTLPIESFGLSLTAFGSVWSSYALELR